MLVLSTGLQVSMEPIVALDLFDGQLPLDRLHRDLCLELYLERFSLSFFAHRPPFSCHFTP